MQHRALSGRSTLDDIGYGFGDPYHHDYSENVDDSEDDSDDEKDQSGQELPSWYNSQPFQYNGRMQLISLPGFILIIAITGDL